MPVGLREPQSEQRKGVRGQRTVFTLSLPAPGLLFHAQLGMGQKYFWLVGSYCELEKKIISESY